MSKRKYARAKGISTTGRYHKTFDFIWEKIPQGLIAELTSDQVAKVVDLMRAQYDIGNTHGWEEAKNDRQ